MVIKHKRFIVPGLSILIAMLWISTAVPASAQSPVKNLGERFAAPDQTIEYHFLLQIPGVKEKDLVNTVQKLIIDPLKPIAEFEPLGKPKPGTYVDSRNYVLAKNALIVRVRTGEITVKARSSNLDNLIDLKFCNSGKYEMDKSNMPFQSISSVITYPAAELPSTPPGLTIPGLWAFMEKKCPVMFNQLKPIVQNAQDIEIPGVATMYTANGKLKVTNDAGIEEAGLSVWFFPPTDKYLVEFAFTGLNKDRPILDKLYTATTDFAKKAGILHPEQATKTEAFFNYYFGTKTMIK
jgi:hypothetical protein